MKPISFCLLLLYFGALFLQDTDATDFFELYTGINVWARSSFRMRRKSTVEECARTCATNIACSSFVYSRVTKFCYGRKKVDFETRRHWHLSRRYDFYRKLTGRDRGPLGRGRDRRKEIVFVMRAPGSSGYNVIIPGHLAPPTTTTTTTTQTVTRRRTEPGAVRISMLTPATQSITVRRRPLVRTTARAMTTVRRRPAIRPPVTRPTVTVRTTTASRRRKTETTTTTDTPRTTTRKATTTIRRRRPIIRPPVTKPTVRVRTTATTRRPTTKTTTTTRTARTTTRKAITRPMRTTRKTTTTTTATTTTTTEPTPRSTRRSRTRSTTAFSPANQGNGEICERAIGLEDGSFPYDQITSSSYYWRFTPSNIGINSGSGWMASTTIVGEYIEIDFGEPKSIVAVATQGSSYLFGTEYVSEYQLKFLFHPDGIFETYKENGQEKIFTGNTDSNTIQKNRLLTPVRAFKVQIHPLKFNKNIMMRAEVFEEC